LVGADNLLSPSEFSGLRNLKFNNPNNEAFTVTFNVIETFPNNDWTLGFGYRSSGSSGGDTGSGGNSASSAPSSTGPTTISKLLQVTYNPLLNTLSVRLVN
jgi:hypothetical protein